MLDEYKSRNIVALSTPPINAALAIIRISGPNVLIIFNKVFNCANFQINDQKRQFYYGKIINPDTKEILDEVIALTYHSPKSFTGENMVEIICHGNMLLVDKIISLLIEHGTILAKPGEFSQQAFLNNKIDILKAEAINNLINSKSNISRIIATKNMLGNSSNFISNCKLKIIDIISQIEVSIDYPEYNEYQLNKNQIYKDISSMILAIDKVIKDSKIFNKVSNYVNVAIIGKPNVGKSSLLNALLKQNKAIISNIPGTTRDIVEGEVTLNNLNLKLLDTAGIRNTKVINEKLGISKTYSALKLADLVLYVVDKDFIIDQKIINKIKNKTVIFVQNKKDIYKNHHPEFIAISAKNFDIDNLIKKMEDVLHEINIDWENHIVFFNNNVASLKKLLSQLKIIQAGLNDLSIDLVLLEFYNAIKNIQEILGESLDLDISSKIFSKYCIGK